MKSSREASGPGGSGGGSGDRGVYSALPAARGGGGGPAGRVNIRTACRPGGGLSQGGPAARASWCQLGARAPWRWAGRQPAASLTERLVRGSAPPRLALSSRPCGLSGYFDSSDEETEPWELFGLSSVKARELGCAGGGGCETGGQHCPHSLLCWGHALHAHAGTLLHFPAEVRPPAWWLWFCCHCLPRSLLSTYCVCRPGQAEEGPGTRMGDFGVFLFVLKILFIYL